MRMWRLGSINKEPALRSQEGLKSKERSFSILYYHSDSYMFTYVATRVKLLQSGLCGHTSMTP